jgi:thiol-disulfide isomerase/thioredoxin
LGLALALIHCGGPGVDRSSGPALRPATVEALRREIARPGARAVVLNVWATWCAPCREEFPDLVKLERAYGPRGMRLMLVSADFAEQAESARRFLAAQGVDFPSYIKTGDDMEFIAGLERRWSGALPATFVYDGRGSLRHFQQGRTTFTALERRVLEAFQATDSTAKEASP